MRKVSPEVGVRTANKVWDVWGDAQIRGWGRNVLAINSARIGNPERAIYHLTNFGYWAFGDQGFAHRSGPSESYSMQNERDLRTTGLLVGLIPQHDRLTRLR